LKTRLIISSVLALVAIILMSASVLAQQYGPGGIPWGWSPLGPGDVARPPIGPGGGPQPLPPGGGGWVAGGAAAGSAYYDKHCEMDYCECADGTVPVPLGYGPIEIGCMYACDYYTEDGITYCEQEARKRCENRCNGLIAEVKVRCEPCGCCAAAAAAAGGGGGGGGDGDGDGNGEPIPPGLPEGESVVPLPVPGAGGLRESTLYPPEGDWRKDPKSSPRITYSPNDGCYKLAGGDDIPSAYAYVATISQPSGATLKASDVYTYSINPTADYNLNVIAEGTVYDMKDQCLSHGKIKSNDLVKIVYGFRNMYGTVSGNDIYSETLGITPPGLSDIYRENPNIDPVIAGRLFDCCKARCAGYCDRALCPQCRAVE